jgi:RNA polymerase sigma-70 factor (ECF subfamily)
MIDATRTTSTLLAALHGGADEAAWREIDGRYRPILVSIAKRAGLYETDAAEVAQDAMADLFGAFRAGRYDRSRGRLRQFLIGIAQMKIADAHRRRARAAGGEGTVMPASSIPDTEPGWAGAWEAEQRAAVLARAIEELRGSDKLAPHTLAAFELVALRQIPAAEAAAQLGLSVQEVYLAKSRCLERVRAIIGRLSAAYDDD